MKKKEERTIQESGEGGAIYRNVGRGKERPVGLQNLQAHRPETPLACLCVGRAFLFLL